jgi:Zn-dependent alcohol dehydrogenase
MRVTGARARHRILAGTLLFVGAGLAPVAAARAATTRKPVVVSVAATPKTLAAAGGTIRLVVKDKHAKTCTITSLPKLAGVPKTVGCAGQLREWLRRLPTPGRRERQSNPVHARRKYGPGVTADEVTDGNVHAP